MAESNGVIFRVEKNKDYTVMSNHHLRNIKLTLKAKGLLTLILSLPDNWDYSMAGLVAICGDGFSSVKSGVKELENNGYLRREQERRPDGTMGKVQFFVSEIPTFTNGLNSEFAPQGENPLTENHIQSNTNQSSINQSFSPENEEPQKINCSERIEQTEREIKALIEYDILLERFDNEQINELFEIMLEVYLHDGEYLTTGKEKKLTALIKRRFAMLTFESINSVIDWLQENTTKIKDMKVYLIT